MSSFEEFPELLELFPDYPHVRLYHVSHWGINPFGPDALYIGDETAAQGPRHMLEENDRASAPMASGIRPEDNLPAVNTPWQGMRGDDRAVEAPPNTREANNIFVAAPVPHAPTRIDLDPAEIRWRDDDSNESENIDESDSDSDRTVTDWELDEEFVGLNYSDDSDVENDDASTSDEELDVATLAPHAPMDSGTYSESVGEILTHESWNRVLAGIPPGMPLPHEERQGGNYANPMEQQGGFYVELTSESDVNVEDNNSRGPNEAQLDTEYDSVATSDQAQSEVEDDIFGGTPPPVVVDDAKDADFDYGQAEAENGGYQYEYSDADADADADDEGDDLLADIQPHRDDSEDDDFLPGNKRAPRRKARGTAGASTRKQGKKPQGRAQGRVRPTPNASHSRIQMPGTNVPAANNVATASQPAPANAGPANEASDEAPLPGESVQQCAQRLQREITELRGEVTAAEGRYEEAANNPRALTDPRTKKRRMAKLEELRKKLTEAVEKQAQFEERFGLPRTQHEGNVVDMASTGSAAVASSSTTPSASTMQNRHEVLQGEVNKLQSTIRDLQRKVTHCQAQVNDVEANPHKFVNKRAGFKQGRITRLENAQHNLAHHVRMLEDKQRLLEGEQESAQGVASSSGQAGQQPQQQEFDQLQLLALATQSSTPQKRKASQMHDDDDEHNEHDDEAMHARSKSRLC